MASAARLWFQSFCDREVVPDLQGAGPSLCKGIPAFPRETSSAGGGRGEKADLPTGTAEKAKGTAGRGTFSGECPVPPLNPLTPQRPHRPGSHQQPCLHSGDTPL